MDREKRPQAVEDAVSFIKKLIAMRAKDGKGNINYKLIKLANEGVDEVMDFLLKAPLRKYRNSKIGVRLRMLR